MAKQPCGIEGGYPYGSLETAWGGWCAFVFVWAQCDDGRSVYLTAVPSTQYPVPSTQYPVPLVPMHNPPFILFLDESCKLNIYACTVWCFELYQVRQMHIVCVLYGVSDSQGGRVICTVV